MGNVRPVSSLSHQKAVWQERELLKMTINLKNLTLSKLDRIFSHGLSRGKNQSKTHFSFDKSDFALLPSLF
jgi:hypothetical protein